MYTSKRTPHIGKHIKICIVVFFLLLKGIGAFLLFHFSLLESPELLAFIKPGYDPTDLMSLCFLARRSVLQKPENFEFIVQFLTFYFTVRRWNSLDLRTCFLRPNNSNLIRNSVNRIQFFTVSLSSPKWKNKKKVLM